ncbi:hypothetical protein [Ruicaihuangia caeni]|uniref:Uncharacterized protein n=1 Tax=Ruicaihuangia caeni TaxID=3042517 RepID=A0AAW6T5Q4_9MICO|nr:hypothetical protein [Klugiella sp. YN-L-19]MDI2098006.1 hypothetical protein [Klugiella sp. YN-L-19]
MASVEILISDQKILEYVREKYGLHEGENVGVEVSVETQLPVHNSVVSHLVKVELTYPMEFGELERLAEF